MQLKQIVPGADYRKGDIVRRVIRLEGVVRVSERDEPDFYDDDNVIHARKGIKEGIYSGKVSKGAYRDLTQAIVMYLEGDLSTPHEMPISEFAEWSEDRVN